MADAYQVLFDGQAAEKAFYKGLKGVEVEEHADLPGAVELSLPIATKDDSGSEDLTLVGDDRYKPYARIAVVATPDGKSAQCIFDGYVLAHKIELDPGTTRATLRVWGQDASCLMNLIERVREWKDKSDCAIANEIFQDYGFAKADANTQDDTPKHTERGHTLMQRGTDGQFLRDRARRDGRLFRVCCADQAGQNTGYFIKPKLNVSSDLTLTLNPAKEATVDSLAFHWDVARPTRVAAQVLLSDKDPQKADTRQSGLDLLDQRALADFAGGDDRAMQVILTTPADSGDDLKLRSQALLREAGWFVKCEGASDLARLKAIPRVGQVVQVNGAGKLHSGKYLVWSVRHSISNEAHQMKFVLVRNAVGSG
jgi:hypothetical protein